MVPRYSRKEMTQIWSAKNKFNIWLNIEKHACQAQEDLGVIPKGIAELIESKGNFEIKRIDFLRDVANICIFYYEDKKK